MGKKKFFDKKKSATFHLMARDTYVSDAVEKSIDVRLHKVLDPEIAALLNELNSSDFGSDVEELEEDFVVKANLFGQEVDDKFIGEEPNEKLSFASGSMFDHLGVQGTILYRSSSCLDNEKPRVRRPLDEQFDMLELQEYGADKEEEFIGYLDEEVLWLEIQGAHHLFTSCNFLRYDSELHSRCQDNRIELIGFTQQLNRFTGIALRRDL